MSNPPSIYNENQHLGRPLARQEGQPDHRSCWLSAVCPMRGEIPFGQDGSSPRHKQPCVHKFTFVRAGVVHHHKTFTVSRRIEGSGRQKSLPHQIKSGPFRLAENGGTVPPARVSVGTRTNIFHAEPPSAICVFLASTPFDLPLLLIPPL